MRNVFRSFQSTYDSTGSSGLYDNYNSVTNNGNDGNGPYSSTNGNGSGPYSSPMGNDGGYRSSRSSYGAAPSGNGHGDDRDRYRYGRFAHCYGPAALASRNKHFHFTKICHFIFTYHIPHGWFPDTPIINQCLLPKPPFINRYHRLNPRVTHLDPLDQTLLRGPNLSRQLCPQPQRETT